MANLHQQVTVDDDWNTVDVTSHVGSDAGSVALVVLQIINQYSGPDQMTLRTYGGTSGIQMDMGTATQFATIAVDSSDRFEVYTNAAATWEIWLVGYFTNSEAKGYPNMVYHGSLSTSGWTDKDYTSERQSAVTATAKLAFLHFFNSSGSNAYYLGHRPNGYTAYTARSQIGYVGSGLRSHYRACALDSGEIFEFNSESTDLGMYLTGYVHEGFVPVQPYVDLTPTTKGSWQTVSAASQVPLYANALMFDLRYGLTGDEFGKHTTGLAPMGQIPWAASPQYTTTGFVALDKHRQFRAYCTSSGDKLWLAGYFTDPSLRRGRLRTIKATD